MYIFSLIRPINGIIGIISVIIGALLSQNKLNFNSILFASLVCFFMISGVNVLNDFVDAEIDCINKPQRAIPSGLCTRRQAIIISIIFFSLALILTIKLNFIMFLLAILSLFLGVIYNFNLKKSGIYGNLTVSALGGLPFIYGGLSVNNFQPSIIPFFLAFLLHLPREIIKDVEDVSGDKKINSNSLAITYGNGIAIRISILFLIILLIFSLFPYIYGFYKNYYLISLLALFYPLCIFIIINLLKHKEKYAKISNKLLKLLMLIGLLVLFLSSYG